MRVAAQALLPASPETAWPVLVDWENQPRWMSDAVSVRVLTSHREGAGVRIAARSRVLGVPVFAEELEVTLWALPHRLVIAHRGFLRGVGEWTLEARDDGSLFRWEEDVSLPIPILGELVLLLYRPLLQRLMRRSLANLQVLLRTEAS